MQKWLLSLTLHFDPLKDVKGKKPATLNNFHILSDILIIFGRAIYQVKIVSHAKIFAVLNCLLFELSHINKCVVVIILIWLSICIADH